MKKYRPYILVLVLLGTSTFFRFTPVLAEWYSRNICPSVSALLVMLSKWMSFALSDLLYILLIGAALWFIARILFCRGKRVNSLYGLILLGLWTYTIFQLFWGINYSRADFFERNQIERQQPDTLFYKTFSEAYIQNMNETFEMMEKEDNMVDLQQEIEKQYSNLAEDVHIYPPKIYPNVKPMLFGRLFAGMGIQGYYGFIACEPLINPYSYQWGTPFLYAHEMAHVMGITGEGEANFMAWLICVSSENPTIRFSGYFSILNYMLSDAGRIVSSEFAKELWEMTNPQIQTLKREEAAHYRSLYWEKAGELQGKVYNSFLKSQGVSDGIANYSQVISYIVAYTTHKDKRQ